VIDLSIVVVSWHTRECALEREDPALRPIEYHRSLYRFSRKNGERSRMAIVSVLRIAEERW
jgi:hypothetical protein